MDKGTGDAHVLLRSVPGRHLHELYERRVGFKLRSSLCIKDKTAQRNNNQYQRSQMDRALRFGE